MKEKLARREYLDAGTALSKRSLSQRVLRKDRERRDKFFRYPSKKELRAQRRKQQQAETHPLVAAIRDPQIVRWGDREFDLTSLAGKIGIQRDSITGVIFGYR